MNKPTQICRLALQQNMADGTASSEHDIEFLLSKQEGNTVNVPFNNSVSETSDGAITMIPIIDAAELLGEGVIAKIKFIPCAVRAKTN